MFRRLAPVYFSKDVFYAFLLAFGLGGCGSEDTVCTASWFATNVVSTAWGTGQSFGRNEMPKVVLGPPQGGGCCNGSLDVVSLGNGGSVVLGFERRILDGPGADFVVFENPFEFANDLYAELGTVEVSDDGVNFHAFPCTAVTSPFGRCAGWHPVFLNGVEQPVIPSNAGGDAFDLGEVGLTEAAFVRVTDRVDIDPPDHGSFDLDAVGIVHGSECGAAP